MGRFGALSIVLVVLVGGCATGRESHPSALPAFTIDASQRVVAYPHGRLLYGDGSEAYPYTWVWVPTGAAPPPPAPAVR